MKDLCLSRKLWGLLVCPESVRKWLTLKRTYNDHRIIRAEKEMSGALKLARSPRRAKKLTENLAENEVFRETEGLLYAPGIAD